MVFKLLTSECKLLRITVEKNSLKSLNIVKNIEQRSNVFAFELDNKSVYFYVQYTANEIGNMLGQHRQHACAGPLDSEIIIVILSYAQSHPRRLFESE